MRATAAVTLLVALATVASCDRKQDGRASTGKPIEGERAAAEPTARRGGRAVLPSNEPTYLNPVLETRTNRVLPLVFEGLIGLDGALEPVPVLAESWTVAPDGRSIKFKLRPGVTWHDGKPFTSEDVAFTVKAIAETAAPTSLKAYFSIVSKVSTPDDLTVEVTYARPYAPALMTWTVGILPAHIYGGGALEDSPGNKEPVGTGPYRMTRWEPGARILLEANPSWWNGRANLDRVEILFDVADPLAALANGQIDFADVPEVEAWSTRTQLPEFRDDFEVQTVPGSLFRMIAWNLDKKPFDDRRVRTALTMALDRHRVIEDVLLGEARAMSAPFFPTMFGADPEIAPLPFDLEKAGKLLDEPGWIKGPDGRFALHVIAIASQKTATNEEMWAIFRHDLAALGVALSVEYLSARDFEARIVKRDFDAAFLGWLPDIADPDPSALLHSSQRVGQNLAGFASPEVDKLLETAAATPNREERKAQYHKLHAILAEQLPYTVLYAPFGHYAWSRRLRGVSAQDVSQLARFPGLSRWWAISGRR
jgi:peptide/nickel transport system substrate-binding protein